MDKAVAMKNETLEDIFPRIVAILEDFLGDFDSGFDGEITRRTRLMTDLGFESIDIIQLVVAIDEEIGKRDVQFEKLLMNNGSYVEDLEVGQIVDFLSQ